MEIRHASIDDHTATIQILRMTCPKCHEPVQFAICEDDRVYQKDAEYYEKRCGTLLDEIHRLNGIIDEITHLQL